MKAQLNAIVAIILIIIQPAVAQQTTSDWRVSFEPPKRFIENKSQFDGGNELPGSQILFGVDWGSTQIYFTKNGLTYRFDEKEKADEKEEREGENFGEENEKTKIKTDVIHMRWKNSNPSVRLIGLEPTQDYFSYTVGENKLKNINRIKGYEKLLYQNLYPNIDVEYAFYRDGGIKYKIILHPGADISKVKMTYSHPFTVECAAGSIRVNTLFGDIIDHRPHTFYTDDEERRLASCFHIEGDTISFRSESFDHSKSVTIDPWTVTPSMPDSNKAYYIKADSSGNVYVYGGDNPYRLQKYNSSGAVQWTYNLSWNAVNSWFGALAVDPPGNCYITSGAGAQISKVNTSGGLVWHDASKAMTGEYWAPIFNCDYSQLLVGGTNLVDVFTFKLFGAVYEINLNNGAVLNMINIAGKIPGSPNSPPYVANEVRTMWASPNGFYYFLTLDTIGSISQNLSINYEQSSSYDFSYYLPYGQGGTGQGINGICATANSLYTTDGHIIHRRDISNGNITYTDTIPNGIKELNSGIAVDNCGNVYAGASGMIHKFDSNLNLISSVNTPAEVYDVTVTGNGQVLACGKGFAASINMGACAPISDTCSLSTFFQASTSSTKACNGECSGTATANTINGSAPYSYLWSNGQTTQTASGLCAGTYHVTVTDSNGSPATSSVTIQNGLTVFVGVIIGFNNADINATSIYSVNAVFNYSYAWSVTNGSILSGQGTNSIEVAWDSIGQGLVQVIASDQGCEDTVSKTITVINTTGIHDAALNKVELYPNPTNGTITLKVANVTTIASLRLYDSIGKQLLQQDATPNELQQGIIINIQEMNAGVFFLSIKTNAGTRVMKVVKY